MTHHERATLADRCARCDGTPDAQALLAEARAQVEEARRERDDVVEKARVSDLMLRLELSDRKNEAASYANAIGLIESTLGIVGGGLLCKTVRAVDAVVKQLADARASAEQAVKVAEALAAEKSALASRVAALEAALRVLHPERLDFDAHSDECLECRSSYTCDTGLEPTPECDKCAHAVLERVRLAVRKALARRALEVEP